MESFEAVYVSALGLLFVAVRFEGWVVESGLCRTAIPATTTVAAITCSTRSTSIEELPESKLRSDPHLWAEGEEFCRREGCTMPFWAAELTPLVVQMYGFEPCPVLDDD